MNKINEMGHAKGLSEKVQWRSQLTRGDRIFISKTLSYRISVRERWTISTYSDVLCACVCVAGQSIP